MFFVILNITELLHFKFNLKLIKISQSTIETEACEAVKSTIVLFCNWKCEDLFSYIKYDNVKFVEVNQSFRRRFLRIYSLE